MHWLIVEDSLRSLRGHWYETVTTFHRELQALGDTVSVLVDRKADPEIVRRLNAEAVLPESVFAKMNGAGRLGRYALVGLHSWRTWRRMSKWLKQNPAPDVIFVPTVMVHHLLGWRRLIKQALVGTRTRVVLYFPYAPVQFGSSGEAEWIPAPTSKLTAHVIRSLGAEVKSGRVILGVETRPMSAALTRLTGVEFRYLAQPVVLAEDNKAHAVAPAAGEIVMGSYGGARHEKGADILVAGVEGYLKDHPDTNVRFVLQMADAFMDDWRRLLDHPKVEIVEGYFPPGEYPRRLSETHVILLPYRRSSYGLRGSRVVIEAMVSGFPVVTSDPTTLSDMANDFGAGVNCRDEDPASLAMAIREAELHYDELRHRAAERRQMAIDHFSVAGFRAAILK